ncbi:MAG TPA: sigma-70 family RNA polymerase sigma factor [Gemmatimonadaceae bacterium]|nr:sigma-70 family RNA polymerase sigma factor [Gemmatimonadaceae bacterium]
MKQAAVTRSDIRGYNWSAMTDADLVRAVLSGEQTAFAALVDRHARICLRYATRMLGNVQDAEDVAQETFLRAYGALHRYDEALSFRTWLMTILINRCRSTLLTRSRRDARILFDDETVRAAIDRSSPADGALRDAIDRAVATLDAPMREAFLLKYVEDLSYEEMAAVTGVGMSALKMRVHRACERLQKLLGDDRYE